MAIRLDVSTSSVVVCCDKCPFWYAFAWTREEAHDSAVRHEQLVHPELSQAEKAREKYRSRHAADSSNVGVPIGASMHGHFGLDEGHAASR